MSTYPTREELRDELSGWPINSGYYATTVGVEDAKGMADAILALFPPSPLEVQPGGQRWRVLGPDGELRCETDNWDEARDAMRPGERCTVTVTEWWPTP